MLYTLVALAVVLAAAFVAYHALKMLWLSSWFVGWVKGMFGLSLLAVGLGIGVVAYDIYSYKQILVGQPVATINFETIENQYFDVVLVDTNGKQQRFSVYGDQWQLDARIIKWQGYFSGFNINPAYRLDNLSGRYYDLHQETAQKRSSYSIMKSPLTLDLWQIIHQHPQWFSVLDANYGSARYLPMKDGALYQISLTNTGLHVRPLNDVASNAMSEWK
jgi:hypothetical protein